MKRKPDTIKDKEITEHEIRKYIGGRIKEMRKRLNLSASLIAGELQVSREAITHIETGRNNISAVSLWKLAVLFKCDPRDFFPSIPDGFAITKVDLRKLEQQDEKAPEWARRLFGKSKIAS